MTNEEIRKSRTILCKKCSVDVLIRNASEIDLVQTATRKDERDKVIWAIEKWVKDNKFFVHKYGDDVVDLSYLLTLLESLKP